MIQFGLCVPQECCAKSLKVFDKIYKQGLILTKVIAKPTDPLYTFPEMEY